MSPATLADRVRVSPSRRLSGELSVPGDKSISHRSVLFNALGEGSARVTNYSDGGDCRSTLNCLRLLGVGIEAQQEPDGSLTLTVKGRGLRGLDEPEAGLDAGNSGTTTRLLAGVLAGQPIFSILDGDGSLRRRPMLRVVEPLRAMGAEILGRRAGDLLPLAIAGAPLRGFTHHPSVASAQVKSAILLAGLFAASPTTVIEKAATRDHTERMLSAQGARLERDELAITIWPPERLKTVHLTVPGDISSAAYWITLACVHPDARVTVQSVSLNPGRTGLLEVLSEMGARIQVSNERLEGGEPIGDVTAESSALRGVSIGGELIPRLIDEIPLLAVAAAFAEGKTVIRDAAELRVKESDRLLTTSLELTKLNARVSELPDGLEIEGGRRLNCAEVSSHGDHRLAMCLAVAGMAARGAEIVGASSAAVSYPSFWEQARTLGAIVE